MKFIFGQVISFITDSLGRVGEFAQKADVLGNLSTWAGNRFKTQTTIIGKDQYHEVDVLLYDGVNYMQVRGVQAIESLKGSDPICDTWFYIGTELDSGGIGAEGDIITMIIAAGDNPTLYPAISIPYTLTAADVAGTEDDLALTLATYYNTQSPFNQLWRAQRIQGNGVIYITARKPGGQYERPNVGDFNVTATGTTVVTRAFDNIVRQNKLTSLARDPADPRVGQLGIQGSVVQSEGDVTNRFKEVFDLGVDGSVTPVDFTIAADPIEVKFIKEIAIGALANGIQFEQFLAKNVPLSNGILISFKTKDIVVTDEPIKTTEDFADLFAGHPSEFAVYVGSGADKLTATLVFDIPLELRPQGEYTTDDYFKITIRDNLTAGVESIRAIIGGFNREY